MEKIKIYLVRLKLINLKNIFLTAKSISIKTGKNTFFLFFDILLCCFIFGSTADDYDKLGFALINNDRRSTYLTTGVNNEIITKNNSADIIPAFKNRTDFYLHFAKYIKREFFNIEKIGKEQFVVFLKNNNPVVLKSDNYFVNSEIRVMNLSEENDYYSLYNRFVDDGHTIIEQFVPMNKSLKEYSPNSLNRLVLTTYCKNSTVYIVKSMLCLDGSALPYGFEMKLYVFVNDDGITITDAVDTDGKIIEINPSNKNSFKNFKIPYYKRAVSFVKELALSQSEINYAEWTLAVSDDDVLLIDATANPSLIQPNNDLIRGESGILSEYRKYIKI